MQRATYVHPTRPSRRVLDLAGRSCVACARPLQPAGKRVRCVCGAEFARHVRLGYLGVTGPARAAVLAAYRRAGSGQP
jgi:hypothetical protein